MKTKLLLFLLLFVGANAFAQYTNIPDINFETKLIALKIDDLPDGKVLTSKINTLKELSVFSSSITDLTGIQDFVSLTTLDVGFNQLTAIDLSKNTALKNFNCYGNQLTNIDLTNNTALETFYCYSNRITSLDLSKNIALSNLDCRGNKIQSLDLSKNIALSSLDCVDNLLTYLNIKNGNNKSISEYRLYLGANSLSCIIVDDVSFSNTNWSDRKDRNTFYSSHDCATITQIPNALFENKLIALGIDTDGENGYVLNNSILTLKTLDLSNSSLTDLKGLEGFTALTTLNCSNNSLKSIDVSKNSALTTLDCSNNENFTCIQVADIALAKSNLKTIPEDAINKFNLDCGIYTLIPDPKFEAKLIALKYDDIADGRVLTSNINTLTSLDLRYSSITDLTGIQDFVALKYLTCSSNKLTSLDVSKNINLIGLTFSINQLTSLDVSKNTALETLTCEENQLTSLDLSKNSALTALRCSSNQLTSLDVSNNTKLYALECDSNKLKALNLKNTKLDILDFSNNPSLSCTIVDDVIIAEKKWSNQINSAQNKFSLYECSTVTQIPDTKFEDKLIALSIDTDGKNGMVFNSSITALTTLDLSNSSITDLAGLEGFTSLKTLNCSSNLLSSIDLSKNTALTSLDCSNNTSLNCIQVADITTAQSNIATTLEAKNKFSLDCNPYTLIPDAKFEAILIGLGYDTVADGKVETKKISGIKTLDISSRSITNLTGIQDFTSLTDLNCKSNYDLTSLDLSKNTALKTLVAYGCKISNLNLSGASALTFLDCGSNQLTTLDISSAIALTTIYSTSNQLSSIDVTKNINLTSLYAGKNKLTTINLTNNLNLDTFTCDENQLTTLDLSKNTKLRVLSCSLNKLTSLNLKSQTPSFAYLTCTGNPFLSCITVNDATYANANWDISKDSYTILSNYDCSTITNIPNALFEDKLIALGIDTDGKNGLVLNSSIETLTALDVSNSSLTDLTGLEGFKALKTLNCANNLLQNINIASNTALTTLDCANNPTLSCITVNDVAAAKNKITTTQDAKDKFSLDCTLYTLIPDTNFEAKLIQLGYDIVADGKIETAKIDKLTSINLSGASITSLKGIEDFKLLTILDCSQNNLTNLDVSMLAGLLNLNCSLNNITSLDITKNKYITTLTCYINKLTYLNLKNGNNTKLSNLSFFSNSDLSCVQVDDVDYANTKWKDQLSGTSFFTTYDCSTVTGIIDPKFEDKLIALAIDTDGKNGVVLNSSIEKITTLDVSNSSISNLSGINGFKTLTTLNCSKNTLEKLDLNLNTTLTNLNCSTNQLTDLDIDKCISLTELNVASNQLTNFDVRENIALTKLNCSSNKLNSISIYKNTALTELLCNDNSLTYLSPTDNKELQFINCSNNKLNTLNISENNKLKELTCNNNQIYDLQISNATDLELLNVSTNKLTTLDVSQNKSLKQLFCNSNQLKALYITQNKVLTDLNCSDNQLTTLNLKNGNNINFNSSNSNFNNNPDLSCIKVDNIAYSDTNWSDKKDASASFSLQCDFSISPNNFTVETKAESCEGENNGEIYISAEESFAYTATIKGETTPFTNNYLEITNLTPGNYTLLIAIPDEDYEQTYNLVIAKGAKVTGKSSVSSKKVNVEITDGTAPYTVFVNGVEQFETSASNFSVNAKGNGLLEVKTAKACEGIYSEDITGLDLVVSAYPNPTSGSFEIEFPTSRKEVIIEINTLDGRVISNKKYTLENGTAQLTLENQPQGVYIATIYLDTIKNVKIIKN